MESSPQERWFIQFCGPRKPIPTRSHLKQPGCLSSHGGIYPAELFVRMASENRVLLADCKQRCPDYLARYNARLAKFLVALQREQLHFENWDGTRRR